MNMQSRMQDIDGLTKAARLSRRGFMTASAASAAGFTLAAGPVRADAIRTDTAGLNAGEAKIAVPGGDMPVYFARPAGIADPPVILVAMEIFGLHEYIKDVTRRLGKLGAFAVAPDYYFRKGVDLAKITDIPALLPIVNTKADAELFSDLDAAAAWAKAQGGDAGRLGIVGFCRGGRVVWRYSTHGNLKAGVAFYGSIKDATSEAMPINALASARDVKEPVLGLYGEADVGILVDQVKEMETALKAAGKMAEFKIYAGAPHGFHADYRASYRKEAAEDAWAKMTAWFKKYGVLGEPTEPPVAVISSQRRAALVIGNSAYRAAPILMNPQRDARSVADALRQTGFQTVELKLDLDRDGMVKALRAFRAQADRADWALVYFAGHGIEIDHINYLIPIDARLDDDRDVKEEAVSYDTLLNATGDAKALKLVILDACRNNPFKDRMRRSIATRSATDRGLAPPPEPEAGTLIAYSAKDGQVAADDVDGSNSPFARAFVTELRKPGLEVRRLFDLIRDDVMDATGRRQQPYTYQSLSGRREFFFVAGK
jgi:carboxymethylenebutenolidase